MLTSSPASRTSIGAGSQRLRRDLAVARAENARLRMENQRLRDALDEQGARAAAGPSRSLAREPAV